MGRSEELGTGLRNVFKYSKAYSGSDKVSFLEEDIFVVNVPLTVDVTENVTENVTEKRSSSIVTEIKLNNNISIDQLAEKLKVSKRTIIRDIEKLKKQNKIARIGPVKGGHWEVGPGSSGR